MTSQGILVKSKPSIVQTSPRQWAVGWNHQGGATVQFFGNRPVAAFMKYCKKSIMHAMGITAK